MDVGASLVTDGKTAELGEPGERPLDLPAVSAETLAVVDAAPGNARAMPRARHSRRHRRWS
jgi:hypothetical protein